MTMIEAQGQGGQVTFDGSFVTIHRKGFLARATVGKGEKRIPVAAITAVQWKPAGGMTNGFIQFTVPGGVESRSRSGHQTAAAAKDENSVVFTRAQMPAFDALRTAVEAALGRSGGPVAAPAASGELERLAELHSSGVLSDEEFTAAKARALGL